MYPHPGRCPTPALAEWQQARQDRGRRGQARPDFAQRSKPPYTQTFYANTTKSSLISKCTRLYALDHLPMIVSLKIQRIPMLETASRTPPPSAMLPADGVAPFVRRLSRHLAGKKETWKILRTKVRMTHHVIRMTSVFARTHQLCI